MPPKPPTKASINRFRTQLLGWNTRHNHRQMPWKGVKDAYRIWLSEIILQQTRVEQGWSYYERFVKTFPSIEDLAAAPDEKVMKLWEGLGYYSRCRNLIYTARYISQELKGEFPRSLESIQNLKGVGPYTAAAIASFAFDLPHAVVDGNVYRVLARVFGIDEAIDSTAGKKYFATLAQMLIDPAAPAAYNQAIMDFGASICKPQLPLCEECPFQKTCVAYKQDRVDQLPLKTKKTKQRTRYFTYFILRYKGELAIRQRRQKDIWQGLYEFPMLETTNSVSIEEQENSFLNLYALDKKHLHSFSALGAAQQQLSHQRIFASFVQVQVNRKPDLPEGGIWVKEKDLESFAFPRLLREFIDASSFPVGS
jgi:A/G-specific adenine glycosylase